MAQVTEVAVPDIGDFSDIPVVEVLVEPGQPVKPEEPLVTLESDKATMEVPAPFGGVVAELRVKVGDKVSQGTVILTMEGVSGDGTADSARAAETGISDAEAIAANEGALQEAGAPGAIETAIVAEASDAPEAADPAEMPPPPPISMQRGQALAAAEPPGAGETGGDIAYASPSVRRRARELGVDLSQVPGTGRKGRITREDVDRFHAGPPAAAPAAAATAPAAAAPAGLNLAPWPQVDFAKFGEIEVVDLPRIKKISGPNLARNWVHIPHVTHNDEADITDLEAFRKQVNADLGAKVTMVALLLKACVASLKAFPDFNASLQGDQLVLKRYYHLGFAADTPGGLVVPVIRDVDQKGLLDIANELRDLSGRAREGRLKITEMQGGTFSISSLGGIGGTSFTPIVNAPEVAILGVTRSAMKPVWDGSQFVPRLMVPLSLSYDHRVIDGAAAARFMVHLTGVLSDLRRVLL